MRFLYRLPLGVMAIVAIVLLNGVHLLIHGTPLDGGSMDMFFVQINAFLSANINTADAVLWRLKVKDA